MGRQAAIVVTGGTGLIACYRTLAHASAPVAMGVRALRSKGAAFQSTPIITLDALTIAYALAPGLSPSSSADCLVMIDTISIPGANSTEGW
jgi:hypothetical protein